LARRGKKGANQRDLIGGIVGAPHGKMKNPYAIGKEENLGEEKKGKFNCGGWTEGQRGKREEDTRSKKNPKQQRVVKRYKLQTPSTRK